MSNASYIDQCIYIKLFNPTSPHPNSKRLIQLLRDLFKLVPELSLGWFKNMSPRKRGKATPALPLLRG